MRARPCILGSLLSLTGVGLAQAGDLSALSGSMTYQEVRTWHEEFLRKEPTPAERLEAMRSVVRTSRFGERGLSRIYSNFEGSRAIDPRISGVEQSLLLQRSDSAPQAKGYRRELLYAIGIHNDPRFSLEEMNRALRRQWGSTDADIVFRHRPTGLYGRIEVKEVSRDSQAANLSALKQQMDKMSLEARKSGHLQFWISRKPVLPELHDYAAKRGVRVLDNVNTGNSAIANVVPLDQAMSAVENDMVRASKRRAIAASTGVAFGVWMLTDSVPALWEVSQEVWNPETRAAAAWRQLGETSSHALSGVGMTVAGGSRVAGGFASERPGVRSHFFSRTAGIASFAALGLGEAFLISRYVYGDIPSREFWITQWVMGGTATGAAAGAWGGFVLGALGNPMLGQAGALAGSALGQWTGTRISTALADRYYDLNFAMLDEAYGSAVYRRYGVK